MESPVHTQLQDIVRALLPAISASAAGSATPASPPAPPQTIIQFAIRDKRVSAYVAIDRSTQRETLHTRDGKHASPDASIFLSTADLLDIRNLGCVRGPVSMTGSPAVLTPFRDKYMSISPEGKAQIEELTRNAAQTDPRTEIERIRPDSLSPGEFLKRYAMASRPVVIVDAMPKWKKAPWTIERIRAEIGDASVNVRAGNYAADIYQASMETKELRLADYLDAYADWDPTSTTHPPYAASNGVPWSWHPWIDYPPFVPESLCSFAKYWIGPAGTATPLHRDWLDNFLTQVVGTKRIALVAPGYAPLLAPRTIHAGLDSCNWVDPYDAADPLAARCSPLFVELAAGEMLFLPAGWFHDVRSASFSFSVNFFLMRVPYAVCPPDTRATAR